MTEHQNTTSWSDIGECGYQYYVSINYLPWIEQILGGKLLIPRDSQFLFIVTICHTILYLVIKESFVVSTHWSRDMFLSWI